MSKLLSQRSQSSEEKLNEIKKRAEARGIQPMTKEALEALLARHRDLWPTDQEIDEFVEWVRRTRDAGG